MELRELLDGAKVESLLCGQGLSREAGAAKVRLFAGVARSLMATRYPETASGRAFFVPGRIEVLGKHTDYGGGSSIVAAVERGFCLMAVPRDDAAVQVCALDLDAESVRFELEPDLQVRHGHWSNYPMTVARRVARNFPDCRFGMDLAFAGDLPPAAGMSSSSALIVATFLALAAVNDLSATRAYRQHLDETLALAAYLGTVENGQSFGDLAGDRGVGTFGGSEDHTAILCSTSKHLGQFAYCPARFERRIRLPSGVAIAVGHSGVVAEKTGSAQELYNRASRRVSALVEQWQQLTGGSEVYLADILASRPDAAEELKRHLASSRCAPFTAEELIQRLDHFAAESDIIGPAGDALTAGDLEEFGRRVDCSQQLSEDLLGNQIPETSGLARLARQCGALAASAFGAGFGGSVWALVSEGREGTAFTEAWSAAYRREFPQAWARSTFFRTGAGPAALPMETA